MEAALSNSDGQLKAIVERIEFVETELREKQDNRKEIYLEAKSAGLNVPAIRAIVRMRKDDPGKRAEREESIDLYLKSLGMFR